MTGLNARQRRFVREYLVDLNGTQAAIRSGYSARGADVQAIRLLANARVAAAIAEATHAQEQRLDITSDRALQECAIIAFSDPGDVLDFSGPDVRLRPANEIPKQARRTIQSIKVKRYVEGNGDNARDVEVTEFKFWSKDAALEKLFKHLGLFANDSSTSQSANIERIMAALHGRPDQQRVYDA